MLNISKYSETLNEITIKKLQSISYPTRDTFGVEGDAFCSRNSHAVITTGSENVTWIVLLKSYYAELLTQKSKTQVSMTKRIN